ncbi:MAG: aa3-type cytochrome c oxidase subunit IV [Rhizobiaceae bacterium]
MAHDAPTGPAELGAKMDYAEHERTFSLFVAMIKYGTVACVALMAAMAFSFFTPAGMISGFVLFALICAAGYFVLR